MPPPASASTTERASAPARDRGGGCGGLRASRPRRLVIDLDNLDATIRLFDSEADSDAIKPKPVPPRHQAFRGEVTRIVLTTLRNAKKPLTTRDIAQRVMAERRLDAANERLLRLISRRTGACLRAYRKRALVRSEIGTGQCFAWEHARELGFDGGLSR